MQTTRGGIASFGPTVIDSMLLASVTSTSIEVTVSSLDSTELTSDSFATSNRRSIRDEPESGSDDADLAVVLSFNGSGVEGETKDEKKGEKLLGNVAEVTLRKTKIVITVNVFILKMQCKWIEML